MTVLARRDERSLRPGASGAESTGLGGERAQTELLEPASEVLRTATHHRGEDAEVVAADGEHLPVEVLALELDGSRVAGDDRGIVVVDLVETDEVDGEAIAQGPTRFGQVDLEIVRATRQELVRWHAVELGETEEPWDRDRSLAPLVRTQDGGLELLI